MHEVSDWMRSRNESFVQAVHESEKEVSKQTRQDVLREELRAVKNLCQIVLDTVNEHKTSQSESYANLVDRHSESCASQASLQAETHTQSKTLARLEEAQKEIRDTLAALRAEVHEREKAGSKMSEALAALRKDLCDREQKDASKTLASLSKGQAEIRSTLTKVWAAVREKENDGSEALASLADGQEKVLDALNALRSDFKDRKLKDRDAQRELRIRSMLRSELRAFQGKLRREVEVIPDVVRKVNAEHCAELRRSREDESEFHTHIEDVLTRLVTSTTEVVSKSFAQASEHIARCTTKIFRALDGLEKLNSRQAQLWEGLLGAESKHDDRLDEENGVGLNTEQGENVALEGSSALLIERESNDPTVHEEALFAERGRPVDATCDAVDQENVASLETPFRPDSSDMTPSFIGEDVVTGRNLPAAYSVSSGGEKRMWKKRKHSNRDNCNGEVEKGRSISEHGVGGSSSDERAFLNPLRLPIRRPRPLTGECKEDGYRRHQGLR